MYDNQVWPMPITLDLPEQFVAEHGLDTATVAEPRLVLLRDPFFNPVAVLHVSSVYRPDKTEEATAVFGTADESHPGVHHLFHVAAPLYVSGRLEGLQLPAHFDFVDMRLTPRQVRARLAQSPWPRTVAFQTRNPMHRAHIEVTRLAASKVDAMVLIHPVVGMTKPGDVSYTVRVRCYKAIIDSGAYYAPGQIMLSLLPLAMRMAGPREALWHAIIRQNYGASHFIVGRDHAGCKSASGDDFYGPYDAQALVASVAHELAVQVVPFQMVAYVPELDTYLPADQVPAGMDTLAISGTKFRRMMAEGADIPAWFSHPDVIRILQQVSPPLRRRGFALFFTGLSGSGKTTIETALLQALASSMPTRNIEVLDGDVVRTHLSSKLGFSVEDRNTNVARVGYVASLVGRHGGIALCSNISPFEDGRRRAKDLVTDAPAGYVLVHVSTPLEVCQSRDVKGLYALAASGKLKRFTGVTHPYELPDSPDITIDASVVPVADSVRYIMAYLQLTGYVDAAAFNLGVDTTPEALLASAGVMTAGAVDPASRLCRAQDPRVVVATGPAPALAALLRAVDSSRATLLPAAQVLQLEQAYTTATASAAPIMLEAPPARPATAEADLSDPQAASGMPHTSALTDAQIVEAGYDVLTALHSAAGRGGDRQPLLVAAPRVAPYLDTMLRVDPCLKVVVFEEAAGAASHAHALAALRPTRVTVAADYDDVPKLVKALNLSPKQP